MLAIESDVVLLACAGAAAGALYWLRRPMPGTSSQSQVEPGPVQQSAPSARHLEVLPAQRLFDVTGTSPLVELIRQRMGFTPENFERDVRPLLAAFAEFVQLLPASESHHHAQPGGLLVHLLEVAAHALHFRDAYKLPLGVAPEEQTRLAARYTYAVLVAGLLHDIGKPVTDVVVQLQGASGESKPWVPLGGTMQEQGADWYTVDFPAQREYRKHERLGLPLLRTLVPGKALAWIGEHSPLMDELFDYLGGEQRKGVIAELVGRADRESVASNLATGPRTRFASARAVPLIERLMGGLRRVLAEGSVSINRAGAVGFCDGESLWCVSGSIAKLVRDHLAQTEQRRPGAAGIPDDNSRLFDTWQEYGAAISNEAGAAIWTVKIAIGTWSQRLTVLRFPLSILFQDPAQYPAALPPGAVSVADVKAPRGAAGGHADDHCPPASPVAPSAPAEQMPPAHEEPIIEATDVGAGDDKPVAGTSPGVEDLPEMDDLDPDVVGVVQDGNSLSASIELEADDQYLDDIDSAIPELVQSPEVEAPELMSAPVAPRVRAAPAPAALPAMPARKANVERFMAWIQSGVSSGSIAYNEANAAVHFCEEGMLLVSPKIFKDYADNFEARIDMPTSTDGAPSKEPWRVLQQQFQKSEYPQKSGSGSFLHRYNVSGPGGKQLTGILIPGPERFFQPVPAANQLLKPASAGASA
ncbi:relaxase [Achromobacter marplatensis]|nr:MobH family relaxase [Achromobacter marplatensis]OWT68666.1 relaxase [Achromobacter marplatensis]